MWTHSIVCVCVCVCVCVDGMSHNNHMIFESTNNLIQVLVFNKLKNEFLIDFYFNRFLSSPFL